MMTLGELKHILRNFGLSWFGKYYSRYPGVVVSNEDPRFLGRIQLKCETIFGDQTFERWVPGSSSGLFAIPDVGEYVWVSFQEGDPRFPIWSHGYHSDGTVPVYAKNNGNKPTNRVFYSPAGQRIELDYKEGDEKVRVHHKQGYAIEINNNGISLLSPTGKNIFLGGLNVAAEPGVLGNKNSAVLTDLQSILSTLQQMLQTVGSVDATIATGLGLSYGTTFATVASTLAPQITALTAKIAATKSTKIKLD